MKQLKKKLLAIKVEYYWRQIQREKKLGKQLIERGSTYTSKEFIDLNDRFSGHCAKAVRAQREYEAIGQAGK
jgi:hypothetical protein